MDLLHYLPYVLLFALATMIVYGWGLVRSQRQQGDLMKMLSAKGASAIRKALKKGPLTRKELEDVVKNLTAGQPFSRRRMGVTDPAKFLDALLPYMITQRMITQDEEGGKTVYRLR